ncbi:MAG: 6-bladed beta-propeller, partial [Gemmatimonadales bacterium]
EQSSPPSLHSTPIQVAPHPDNGGAVAVWRAGEDLNIANGLDIIRYTSADVVVPLSGLARDDGLPSELWGRFTDLEPETSEVLGLVGPVSGGAAGVAYSLKFGTNGTGDTNFDNPGQIARDSSGNIYIADYANNRLKKHQADGTYVSSITSLTECNTVCIDSSDNIYVGFRNAASDYRIRKYNSAFSVQWTTSAAVSTSNITGLATGGTAVIALLANGDIATRGVSTGASLFLTSSLLGANPGHIAYSTSQAAFYIADTANDRVAKFVTGASSLAATWGTSGSGDGQFQNAVGIAVNSVNGNIFVTDSGRDDVQEFTSTGSFVRKFSSAGSGDGQTTDPTGVVVDAAGTGIYVADTGNDRVTKFLYSAADSAGQTYPGLYGWTGIGWYGKWKGDTAGVSPNWLHVTATDHAYRAYWGMDDGYLYSTKLARYFENPRRALIAGEREFEPEMEIVTSKFDAAMLGNWKIASHMVVFMEHATATEYLTIEYQTDADSGWNLLGTVNSTTKTYLPFGLDADTGFSSGTAFNWIQFRIRGFSTDSIYKCPLIKSIVFCFIKVPQNTDAYQFVVAFPNEEYMGRSGAKIREDLETLVDTKEMVKLRLHEWDGDQREYRGYLTAVSGEDAASELAGGSRAVNFIALKTSE